MDSKQDRNKAVQSKKERTKTCGRSALYLMPPSRLRKMFKLKKYRSDRLRFRTMKRIGTCTRLDQHVGLVVKSQRHGSWLAR